MRDEQNKNRQTEEDRFIEAYLNRIDAEAPDLWDRIEAGLDREAKDVEEKQKKTSKVKYVISGSCNRSGSSGSSDRDTVAV